MRSIHSEATRSTVGCGGPATRTHGGLGQFDSDIKIGRYPAVLARQSAGARAAAYVPATPIGPNILKSSGFV